MELWVELTVVAEVLVEVVEVVEVGMLVAKEAVVAERAVGTAMEHAVTMSLQAALMEAVEERVEATVDATVEESQDLVAERAAVPCNRNELQSQ